MTNDIAQPQQRRLTADVAIIGAGSGGLVAASGAAQLGLKVVLFEKGEMGGDCLNYGCVPSKSLIAAARAAQAGRTAHRLGVRFGAPEIDWGQVSAHVRGVIEAIAPIDSQERFEGLGVTVVREAAHFVDRTSVASKSVAVRARRIVIATGARAFIPPIPGIETIPYLTNETIFSLDKRPERLVVLGGGAIGLELGQAFRRLGADVVIVEAARIMNGADLDANQVLRERLELEGVALREDTRVSSARVREDATIELLTSGPMGLISNEPELLLMRAGCERICICAPQIRGSGPWAMSLDANNSPTRRVFRAVFSSATRCSACRRGELMGRRSLGSSTRSRNWRWSG